VAGGALPVAAQELEGGEVERIEGADRERERLQRGTGPGRARRRRGPPGTPDELAVALGEAAPVDPDPRLVLEERLETNDPLAQKEGSGWTSSPSRSASTTVVST